MKLSNVVVICLSALLGLLMVCFTAIACTMVVNWSAPKDTVILEGQVCSVQVFKSDYEVEPLADGSAPDFFDMDANADFDLVIDGTPDTSNVVGVWFFPSVLNGGSLGAFLNFDMSFGHSDTFIYDQFVVVNSSVSLGLEGRGVGSTSFYNSTSGGWRAVRFRLFYVESASAPADVLSTFSILGAVKVSDDLIYQPVVYVPPDYVQSVTEVFDGLGVWLITGFNNVISLFWVADTGTLTLLGILAVCGLAVSVFLLIMGIIQNFLHFRG